MCLEANQWAGHQAHEGTSRRPAKVSCRVAACLDAAGPMELNPETTKMRSETQVEESEGRAYAPPISRTSVSVRPPPLSETTR